MNLQQKIHSRQGLVVVIGLGYVGLPLAVAFGEAGFRVVGIDTNKERVDSINRGESYVSDVPSYQVNALTAVRNANGHSSRLKSDSATAVGTVTLHRSGQLSATTDFNVLYDADAVIICVPTPLDESKNPDMSHIIAVTEELGQRLTHETLIVLESTTYPGTTEELVLPRLELGPVPEDQDNYSASRARSLKTKGDSRQLKIGRDFYLAFSPERIDPGRRDYTIHTTPKVLGGVTPQCTEMAQSLYATIIERVVPVSSPKVAEMVKLLENTFRAVNIALVNEFAIICNRLGLDVWEVIEAAKTKPFGFMTFYPGPGLGGHCIPIDPQYLAWKLKTFNYNARFIQLAADVNFDMPHFVLGKIADALNEDGKALKGAKILILGMAYKADVGDMRESPALDLIHLLQEKGSCLFYHDPYVPHLDVDGLVMDSVSLDEETVQAADCIVIITAHSTYDWNWITQHSRLIVDTRNATNDITTNAVRIVKL